jgi:quercetin dioxygenase-like cupin family protein
MVHIGRSRDVEARTYDDGEKARRAEKRVLVGPRENAPNFSMRKFTIGKGGCSPYHKHPWEHEVYVLAGRGEVRFAGGRRAVGPDDFAYVPPNDEHQFVNTGEGAFEFLCVVPLEGEDG